ncbi:MAG: GNAT family N-acetyltransferase [Bacteroidota bacterium]
MVADQEMTIRRLEESEKGFLREMTFLALFVPEGAEPFPRSILDSPDILKYYDGWGREGDLALVLENTSTGTLVGASWARCFTFQNKGYGFLDGQTPEVEIALKGNVRGKGYGTLLINQLIEELRKMGFVHVSLSVDRRNPAIELYKRLGFIVVKTDSNPVMRLML